MISKNRSRAGPSSRAGPCSVSTNPIRRRERGPEFMAGIGDEICPHPLHRTFPRMIDEQDRRPAPLEHARIHRRHRRVELPRHGGSEKEIGGLRLTRRQRLVDRAAQQRVAQHRGGILAQAVPGRLIGTLHRAVGADQNERLGQPLGDRLLHPQRAPARRACSARPVSMAWARLPGDPVDLRQARRPRREPGRDAAQPLQILAPDQRQGASAASDFRHDQAEHGLGPRARPRATSRTSPRIGDGQDEQQPSPNARGAWRILAAAGPAGWAGAQLALSFWAAKALLARAERSARLRRRPGTPPAPAGRSHRGRGPARHPRR